MDIFFADDSRQERPSRPGMGPLVATGGIYVPGDEVQYLEVALNGLCKGFGFPVGEEFKWSPGRDLWMHRNLIGERRKEFLTQALRTARSRGAKAVVVIEDKNHSTATRAPTAEEDVIRLLIERIQWELVRADTYGLLITDRPSGDRGDENRFLTNCLEVLEAGTKYVLPDRVAINVVSTPSKLVRLLQLADVVTSCTTALVAGENSFAPAVFPEIQKLMVSVHGAVGGYGLKIHPDVRYRNLYHWLAGDTYFFRPSFAMPIPMPLRIYPYSKGPLEPKGRMRGLSQPEA